MTAIDGQVPDPTAFWNINVDAKDQTVDCPNFLQYCFTNDKDRRIIGTPDDDYHALSWNEVRDIASRQRPDLFQRRPSELRRYRQYCFEIKSKYGSVLDFVMKERLRWTDSIASDDNFDSPDNYKILYNDWPYGVDHKIVHLIVWTKFEMPEDTVTGNLVPQMQAKVDDFVEMHFNKPCGRENVAWFRNWVSLKSIHAVEHFHVMLFDPDMRFIDKLTGGDEALAIKLGYIERRELQ